MHDKYIKDHIGGLFPHECSKKDYAGVETLMCLPCDPRQPTYTDTNKKYIRVCESLLREFYGNDNLNEKTDKYKECGAWNSPSDILIPIHKKENDPNPSYELGKSEELRLIFPNTAYSNAE